METIKIGIGSEIETRSGWLIVRGSNDGGVIITERYEYYSDDDRTEYVGERLLTLDEIKNIYHDATGRLAQFEYVEPSAYARYRVLDEYTDKWICDGSIPADGLIVDRAEILRLAEDWKKPVVELMEQVEEV